MNILGLHPLCRTLGNTTGYLFMQLEKHAFKHGHQDTIHDQNRTQKNCWKVLITFVLRSFFPYLKFYSYQHPKDSNSGQYKLTNYKKKIKKNKD